MKLKKKLQAELLFRKFCNLLWLTLNKMEKKEAYRNRLPHFQQPGQAYFVTFCLKDSVPAKALAQYSQQLNQLRNEISRLKISTPGTGYGTGGTGDLPSPNHYAIENRASHNRASLLKEYYILRKKYIKAYDDLLDAQKSPSINLSKLANREILIQTLQFWEGKKIKNIAFTIMPNHVHWVLELMKTDMEGKPVYLQDIIQSVKRQSSRQINLAEGRSGSLWHKESFDTTIRDERHLYNAIRYTLNNLVNAGLATDWKNWEGTWIGCGDF